MKNFILTFLTIISLNSLIAQPVYDTVYVQEGYTHQSYYSFANDEVANIINNDWDIALEMGGFGVAIRINGQLGTELYTYPDGDTADWATLDTAGLASWTQSYDSDQNWELGAFNQGADTSSFVDFGWGYYNTTTHVVSGDSLFVIKLSNGDYKKVWIMNMNPNPGFNEYNFKYADIDGSNEVMVEYEKSNYAGKNFGYYSLQNEEEVDREPASDTWDIVFTKYGSLAPGAYYNVTGGLTNKNVWTAQADEVDVESAVWSDYLFNDTISTIGYDWKTLNFQTFEYEVAEDRCYFIEDVDGNIWKVVFTAFGGSSNGMIAFTKEQVGTVGINEVEDEVAFVLYPNPATDGQVNIKFNNESSSVLTTITDLNGRQVLAEQFNTPGEQIQQLDVAHLSPGLYIISIENKASKISKKLIIK
jgi:hypothetical protein